MINSVLAVDHNPLELCCGHDVIEILGVGLRQSFGALAQAENSSSEVARSLILAYERGHFEETDLYKQIKDWEERNVPYRILRSAG